MKKIINIELTIETTSDNKDIEKAIEKGLYYGLDIKHVAQPYNVQDIDISITES